MEETTTTANPATFATLANTYESSTFVDYTKLSFAQTRDLLDRVNYAILRISTKGWVKGADRTDYDHPDTGSACLIGSLIRDEEYAVTHALRMLPYNSPIRRSVENAVGALRSQLSVAVIPQYLKHAGLMGRDALNGTSWNDHPDRTKEEVLKALLGFSNVLSAQVASTKPGYMDYGSGALLPTCAVRLLPRSTE